MIDENSHYSQHQPKSARKYYAFSLENVHPSKVFVTSTGVNSSFRSQEPRRPRFSFFYLHNVKERTITPSPAAIVSESIKLSYSFETEHKALAGCPADQSALFENASSGIASQQSTSLTWPGYIQHRFQCQHPFSFFTTTKPKLDNRNFRKPEIQNLS